MLKACFHIWPMATDHHVQEQSKTVKGYQKSRGVFGKDKLVCPWPPLPPVLPIWVWWQMSIPSWYKPRSEWKGLLLPHVGLRRKVIGRRVTQWGPGYICRFAGWPSQLEPVGGPSGPGGGSSHRLEGWRYLGPRWRLPPRESPRAQGQHKHLRAPPGYSLSMCPPTWGHLTRDFSDKRFLYRTSLVISMSPKQEEVEVIGELLKMLLHKH